MLAQSSQGVPIDSLLGSLKDQTASTTTAADPVHARQLLAQGLQEEGLSTVSQLPPITFTYQADLPALAAEVKLASQMWKTTLGIEVTLRPDHNLAQAIAATRGNASLQLWAANYTPSYPDPYAMVVLPFAQGSPLNAVNYGQNDAFDAAQQQVLQKSVSANDALLRSSPQRLLIYQHVDQTLVSEVAWLPIYMVSQPYLLHQGFFVPFSRAWSPWGSEDYCNAEPPC